MIGVINQDGKRIAHRKVDCDLGEVIKFLKPLKAQLQSMAVESTFQLVLAGRWPARPGVSD